jgi:hypothetical protein
MSSDKSVYHVGDTITYTISGSGPLDHIEEGGVSLSPDIKHITWTSPWLFNFWITCNLYGNNLVCLDNGPGWGGLGDPELTVSGTVTGGTKLVSTSGFMGVYYGEMACPLSASTSNTAEVVYVPPAPEFPSPLLPTAMVIGFLGAVFYIQRTREH